MSQLIALTGATGFIGRHLLRELPKRGFRVRALLRRPAALPREATSAVIGDIARPQNMAAALADVDAVIHSAALAPRVSGAPADDHRQLDTQATIALARAAEKARVKRFVFLSSIKAQAGTSAEEVLTEASPARPSGAYGESKLAAELGLADLEIDWVALRLVLVYGSGAVGNMADLLRIARLPVPLPFGAMGGKRSLLAVENLLDAVTTVLTASGPLRRPFLVADREALTVGEMIAALRRGLGRRPGLVPVPPMLVKLALAVVGHEDDAERLLRPLVVDTSALAALGWTPSLATPLGLERYARTDTPA